MIQALDSGSSFLLVAHASSAVRKRLRRRLETEPGFSVQDADSGALALKLFFRLRPAAALIDVCLPDRSGFDIIRCMRLSAPDCALVLLSHSRDPFVEKVGQLVGAALTCHEDDDPRCLRELLGRLRADKATG